MHLACHYLSLLSLWCCWIAALSSMNELYMNASAPHQWMGNSWDVSCSSASASLPTSVSIIISASALTITTYVAFALKWWWLQVTSFHTRYAAAHKRVLIYSILLSQHWLQSSDDASFWNSMFIAQAAVVTAEANQSQGIMPSCEYKKLFNSVRYGRGFHCCLWCCCIKRLENWYRQTSDMPKSHCFAIFWMHMLSY